MADHGFDFDFFRRFSWLKVKWEIWYFLRLSKRICSLYFLLSLLSFLLSLCLSLCLSLSLSVSLSVSLCLSPSPIFPITYLLKNKSLRLVSKILKKRCCKNIDFYCNLFWISKKWNEFLLEELARKAKLWLDHFRELKKPEVELQKIRESFDLLKSFWCWRKQWNTSAEKIYICKLLL